jgi:hypothetical protein
MKRFATMMLALAFLTSTVTVAFGQETTKKTKKKKSKKKSSTTKDTSK